MHADTQRRFRHHAPWLEELSQSHWFWRLETAEERVWPCAGQAQRFLLSEELCLRLLSCLDRGFAEAAIQFRERKVSDASQCCCFFPHPFYAWDARAAHELMWIETQKIDGLRWAVLAQRTSDGQSSTHAGQFLAFFEHPYFGRVCTFYGSWATLPEQASWKNGILAEVDFVEAARCNMPVFAAHAAPVESTVDLFTMIEVLHDTYERLPGRLLSTAVDQLSEALYCSVGGQFASMFVAANAAINEELTKPVYVAPKIRRPAKSSQHRVLH